MFHPKGPTFFELAVQALSSTQRGYDLLAPKFDYTPFRTPQPLLDAVGEHLHTLGPFDSGLDLCCGTGAAMALLRPHCRERVVGIDFSQGMIEVGRQRTAQRPETPAWSSSAATCWPCRSRPSSTSRFPSALSDTSCQKTNRVSSPRSPAC